MIREFFTDLKGKRHKLYTNKVRPDANQDCITSLTDDKYRGHGRLNIDKLTVFDAYNNLTAEEFGVYIYLAANEDGYIQGYSPRNVANVLGIDIKTARKVKDSLIAKGYLENTGKYENDFYFHRVPISNRAEPEQVGFDRLMAEESILLTDKHVRRQMKYAKTEKDFQAIDETVKLRVESEYPEFAEDAPAEQKTVKSENDIDWYTEFDLLKAECPELFEQRDKATGAEFSQILNEIHDRILKKYNLV